MPTQFHIRNFSIIAHIDHGKSTLADRILEITGLVSARDMREQYLDRMELERERGITIKAQTVRIPYTAADGKKYILNLIDTPGHVDFSYEVSHSLAACEGALLVVDATQGVEAQTLANVYLALDHSLDIIPVLNKIDLSSADPDRVIQEIEEGIGLDCSYAKLVSAKTGLGVAEMLEAVVAELPPPQGDPDAPLKALIFDSWYDVYQGVVVMFRVVDGLLQLGQRIRLYSTGCDFEVTRIGVFSPVPIDLPQLGPGEVGYLCATIKNLKDARVGDTITTPDRPTQHPFPGFKKIKPMVCCGLYPLEPVEYEPLKVALEKLQLNDTFSLEPEISQALGLGFRAGFLGLLHMEIIQERLEREFKVQVIATAPTVIYKIKTLDGQEIDIDNPANMMTTHKIVSLSEPFVKLEIHTPNEFLGNVFSLCEEKRGLQKDVCYLSSTRVIVTYEMPFAEIIFDFFDKLKSGTRGYASLDYEPIEYRETNLVKMEILINGEPMDALSAIVHRDKVYHYGRAVAIKLKRIIPRQLFEIIIQASVDQKIIARERVSPLRKNVTAKCYGGDITRKRKLLEKQKEGKKRMKSIGNVRLPQEVFLVALQLGDD
ncbi:30S ribosomal subunit biogenesis factor LepA [Desulfovibrionales bacterium]